MPVIFSYLFWYYYEVASTVVSPTPLFSYGYAMLLSTNVEECCVTIHYAYYVLYLVEGTQYNAIAAKCCMTTQKWLRRILQYSEFAL